jgi:hypothetical protein
MADQLIFVALRYAILSQPHPVHLREKFPSHLFSSFKIQSEQSRRKTHRRGSGVGFVTATIFKTSFRYSIILFTLLQCGWTKLLPVATLSTDARWHPLYISYNINESVRVFVCKYVHTYVHMSDTGFPPKRWTGANWKLYVILAVISRLTVLISTFYCQFWTCKIFINLLNISHAVNTSEICTCHSGSHLYVCLRYCFQPLLSTFLSIDLWVLYEGVPSDISIFNFQLSTFNF